MSAVYTPAQGDNHGSLRSNEFRAGSKLKLNCAVEGNSGDLSYQWLVKDNISPENCNNNKCAIDLSSTTSTLTLGNPPLLSYYAGNYTCNVSETGKPDTHNDTFSVNVVGECVVFGHSEVIHNHQVLGYMLFLPTLRYLQVP